MNSSSGGWVHNQFLFYVFLVITVNMLSKVLIFMLHKNRADATFHIYQFQRIGKAKIEDKFEIA